MLFDVKVVSKGVLFGMYVGCRANVYSKSGNKITWDPANVFFLAAGAGYISPPLAPTDLIPEKMKFNSRKSEIKWN